MPRGITGEFKTSLVRKPLEENLLAVFERATDGQYELGVDWYKNAANAAYIIANRYGVPVCVVADVIAALSPSVRWETNITQAEEFVRAGSARARKMPTASTYGQMKRIAWTIAKTCVPLADLCKGPKVLAFAELLKNPQSEAVVIDAWILRAALNVAPNETRESLSRAQYAIVAGALRRAAFRVGLRPSEFQATVWIRIRSEH